MSHPLLKRFVLSQDEIKKSRSLRFLGKAIHEPDLWHLNRYAVARAVAIGLFWAMIPMPMQMLAAAITAVLLPWRANLPIAVGLVWITNPFTMPPVFYANYKVGAWLSNTPPVHLPEHLSLDWLLEITATHWPQLYLGSFTVGVLLAVMGYFGCKLFWLWRVRRNWKQRSLRRASSLANN